MLRAVMRPLPFVRPRPTPGRALSRAISMGKFSWATVDPEKMSGSNPANAQNFVRGEWQDTKSTMNIIDPLNGEEFLVVPNTQLDEIGPFVEGLRSCPKYGLHNPLHNPERYVMLGEVCHRLSVLLGDQEIEDFFTRLIQRTVGKSWAQCKGEVVTCRKWLASFSGDNVRNLGRSFALPGDHSGQEYSPSSFMLVIFCLAMVAKLQVLSERCVRLQDPWIPMALWWSGGDHPVQLSTGDPLDTNAECPLHGQQTPCQGR
mmetsp:Transcript_19260/g.37177  ORF Transcript_19260/g.37177 Transcript_19260/m.37177 type:complete len:259 (-) Transcript_19260:487-1263(-)